MMDRAAKERKESLSGQMSFFDFAPEEEKARFEMQLPDVEELSGKDLLTFEKEVLGIYLSGHPLEEDEKLWRKKITHTAAEFAPPEEGASSNLIHGERCIVGGIVSAKTIKYTKTSQVMAFITIEDLTGSVEVLIFPKTYEKCSAMIVEDEKLFVEGRISVEEEKASKVIADNLIRFSDVPRSIWIAFPDIEAFRRARGELLSFAEKNEGQDRLLIYLRKEKQAKQLSLGGGICADADTLAQLREMFGKANVTLGV